MYLGERDVLDTDQTKAHRLALGRDDVSSIVEVDNRGVAIEKYQIGHQTNLSVSEAINLMSKPRVRIISTSVKR